MHLSERTRTISSDLTAEGSSSALLLDRTAEPPLSRIISRETPFFTTADDYSTTNHHNDTKNDTFLVMDKIRKVVTSMKIRVFNFLSQTRSAFSKLPASTEDELLNWLMSKKIWLFGPGSGWREIETPISEALHGPVQTPNGPYVVSTDGRILCQTGGTWVMRTESDPAANDHSLTTVDATSDGKRIWFVGSSGAFGAYDLETTKTDDYSAPKEKTSTWEAIAVTGETGNERLKIANSSGEVLPVTIDANGYPQWGEVTKPGSRRKVL